MFKAKLRDNMHRGGRSWQTCFALWFFFMPLAPSSISDAQQASLGGSSQPPAYKLQSGDTISVFYRITPEYNQSLSVLPDGYIDLRQVGRVHVAGLNVEQARQEIFAKADRIFKDPEVSVSVTDFVRDQFTVMGEVGKAGRYELYGATTIVDALALGGGFTQLSAQKKVVLVRPLSPSSEYGNVTVFNFKQLTRRGATVLPILQNGDIVIVTTSKFAKASTVIKLVNVGLYYNPLPAV